MEQNFNRQRWWRGADYFTDSRLQPFQICLQCMSWPMSCWLCCKLLNLERIDAHTWNKVYQTEVMERSWLDTKFGGVHLMDSPLQPSQLCLQPMIWAIVCWFCGEFLTDRWTHMEQSLTDRGDGDKLIDTNKSDWEELRETKHWRCAFDWQPTTAIPNMPPVHELVSVLPNRG